MTKIQFLAAALILAALEYITLLAMGIILP